MKNDIQVADMIGAIGYILVMGGWLIVWVSSSLIAHYFFKVSIKDSIFIGGSCMLLAFLALMLLAAIFNSRMFGGDGGW